MAAVVVSGLRVSTTSVKETKALLWRKLGTGGTSIKMKVHADECIPIRLSPSGVLNKRMEPYPHRPRKSTDCDPHFMKDWTTPNHGPIQSVRRGQSISGKSNLSVKARKSNGEIDPFPRCVVLDIEGTTTPISFVSEILFPYARDNVGRHLSAIYDTPETKDDIRLLRSQVENDLEQGISGAVPIPPDDAGKEKVIDSLVANVDAMIKADRKITALKELQLCRAIYGEQVLRIMNWRE